MTSKPTARWCYRQRRRDERLGADVLGYELGVLAQAVGRKRSFNQITDLDRLTSDLDLAA